MNGSENQNLTDEQLLKILEEGVSGDETIPEEVAAIDKGDKSNEGKAAHAFAEMKRKQKLLAAEVQKMRAEKEAEAKKIAEQHQQATIPNAGANTVTTVMGQLQMQAMQRLGLTSATANTPEARELIRMERDRLYNIQMQMIEREAALKDQAPQMVTQALEEYPMLGPEGTEAVKRKLSGLSITDQLDPRVIRNMVTSYFGELALSGNNVGGGDGASDANQNRRDGASMAAASGVRNGRPVVKPGSREEAAVKPPTPDEAKKMRDIHITDVRLFREAQKRQHLYAGK